jgi:hypothetical protein
MDGKPYTSELNKAILASVNVKKTFIKDSSGKIHL